MRGDIELPEDTPSYTLSRYLDVTYLQTPNPHQIYVGTDNTMHDFMWDSASSYTPLDPSDITLDTSDIGFEGENSYSSAIWSGSYYNDTNRIEYAIPQDGKVSAREFTMAYGTRTFDQTNSTFDLSWLPHTDNTTRAWYDLGLTPVMWISAEPGGEPQPTYDKSKGVVVAIPSQGVTYEGQHLVSVNEASFLGTLTRATFPITNHKYYVNVGVVDTAVATQLETSGEAPTASQLRSWSISDPSLTYTPSSSQVMYLNGKRNALDISALSRSTHIIDELES